MLYLGHVISKDGVRPDPRLIECVKNFSIPQDIKGVQSFLGLANYYRRYVQNFAYISAPMSELTKKDVPFEWSFDCQIAMDKLKEILTSRPLLIFPDFTKEFILSTDASSFALGSVLSQLVDGVEKPIAYASRKLKPSEKIIRLQKRNY